MAYQHIKVPDTGEMIVVNDDNSLHVPTNPIIPYIEGDGIGVDISPVMISVVDLGCGDRRKAFVWGAAPRRREQAGRPPLTPGVCTYD